MLQRGVAAAFAALLLLVVCFVATAQAKGLTMLGARVHKIVSTDTFTFDPAEISIRPGDYVLWSISDENNIAQVSNSEEIVRPMTVAENGQGCTVPFWSGPPSFKGNRTYYLRQFNVPGEYHYICEPSALIGMKGKVIVKFLKAKCTPLPDGPHASISDVPAEGATIVDVHATIDTSKEIPRFYFDPKDVTIAKGAYVRWHLGPHTNVAQYNSGKKVISSTRTRVQNDGKGSTHRFYSGVPDWSPDLFGEKKTFVWQFLHPGAYHYLCQTYAALGMTGSVTVTGDDVTALSDATVPTTEKAAENTAATTTEKTGAMTTKTSAVFSSAETASETEGDRPMKKTKKTGHAIGLAKAEPKAPSVMITEKAPSSTLSSVSTEKEVSAHTEPSRPVKGKRKRPVTAPVPGRGGKQ
mmetsp:Transcript_32429/g.52510  ORF Transcript_32429/g.52510 Transcript_32429/m.52510 type:complete len:410 (-) Transcript_32429:226-1455(-)